MKVLALNSSPRAAGQSKTELMLAHLVKGMREAGAEVEVVNLRQKKINHCLGCYTCWTKTPGICVHKDEMALELFPKWLASDIVVYASPLYHYTVNADMKAFIERTLPVLQPYLEYNGQKTNHPMRSDPPKSVILSVAGFPHDSVFDALSYWARTMFSREGKLLAEIYRTASEAMQNSCKIDDILDAVEQAGREIITQGSAADMTMARIRQPIADPTVISAIANVLWQLLIDRGMTPAEAAKGGHLAIRPDSIETLASMLAFAFNPHKAGDKRGTLQFNFSGEKPGACYLTMDKGSCTAHTGQAAKADCTVEGPFEVWADIIEGKADGGKMLMEGKYKANGDIALMMVFGR